MLVWLRAKEPLDAERDRLEQQLRQLSGDRVLAEVAGQGASVPATWEGPTLSRQNAIVASVKIDHVAVQ